MYYSIDRFEETIAVLQDDDGNNKNVPRALLPAHAGQGDVLTYEDGRYLSAADETARRREIIHRLQKRLRDAK